MLWLIHPNVKNNNSEVSSTNSSFPINKGKVPSKLFDEEELDDSDDFPMNKSLDFALSQNKHLHEQQKVFNLESIRIKKQKFMASSWFGHVYLNFFLVVSIFSCGQYIYQTYLTNDSVRIYLLFLLFFLYFSFPISFSTFFFFLVTYFFTFFSNSFLLLLIFLYYNFYFHSFFSPPLISLFFLGIF